MQYKKPALIKRDIKQIAEYPAWSTTHLASIRITDGKRFWTDCHVSVILKRGRVQFIMTHEKGYPSDDKGMAKRSITASWLSVDVPKV